MTLGEDAHAALAMGVSIVLTTWPCCVARNDLGTVREDSRAVGSTGTRWKDNDLCRSEPEGRSMDAAVLDDDQVEPMGRLEGAGP